MATASSVSVVKSNLLTLNFKLWCTFLVFLFCTKRLVAMWNVTGLSFGSCYLNLTHVCYVHNISVLSEVECMKQRESCMRKDRMSDGLSRPVCTQCPSDSVSCQFFLDLRANIKIKIHCRLINICVSLFCSTQWHPSSAQVHHTKPA